MSTGEALLSTLIDGAHLCAPDDVADLVAESAAAIGARHVDVYVVDYGQERLVRLGAGEREVLEIDGTVAGRAFRTIAPVETEEDSGRRLWLPLLNGTSRVGILGVSLDGVDELVLRRCERLAALVADLIITKNRYGDSIARARRSRELTLAAEMQWDLLPPLTFSNGRMTITGILEPSYEIAGDTFDYSLNGGVLHAALIDAMGHGFDATMIAAAALSAYRHSRRRGDDLLTMYAAVDELIGRRFGPDRFATAQLFQLDTDSGILRWLNAGHPDPLLLRGGRVVGSLHSPPSLPIGIGVGDVPEVSEQCLEPGDVLVWYTDGVVEARSAGGDFFGEARLADMVVRAAAARLPAPETLRRLNQAVLQHQGGHLQDDATTLLVEWHGPRADEPGP